MKGVAEFRIKKGIYDYFVGNFFVVMQYHLIDQKTLYLKFNPIQSRNIFFKFFLKILNLMDITSLKISSNKHFYMLNNIDSRIKLCYYLSLFLFL